MVRLHSDLHPLTVDKVLEQLNFVSFQLLSCLGTLKMGGAVSVQQQRTPPSQSWLCTCECRLIRESGGCAAGACMHANSSASKAKLVSEAASPSLPFSLRSSFLSRPRRSQGPKGTSLRRQAARKMTCAKCGSSMSSR
jgi:hypothetical protein